MLSVKAEKIMQSRKPKGENQRCEGGRIERAIIDTQTITQQHSHILWPFNWDVNSVLLLVEKLF